MPNELRNIFFPTGPAPTIGNAAMRMQQAPLRRRIDFYDTAGRLHGLISLVPVLYGLVQTQREIPLKPWYWLCVLATFAFAIFARRSPFLRISTNGISFPEKGSTIYPWDQMCEAHARANELDILMADGQRITISYRSMRHSDIERVKKLIKQQFQLLAEQARDYSQAMAA